MPAHQALPRSATEPEAVITDVIGAIEPELPAAVIEAVVVETVQQRPRRRELAVALLADPDLLTSGSSEGPRQLGRLIEALQARGSRHLRLPRCAECGQAKPLRARRGIQRICYACWARGHRARNRCVICGNAAFAYRDRHGQPRCRRCPPDDGRDPMEELCDHIEAIGAELPRPVIADVINSTTRRRSSHRRLVWAIEDTPTLLTGDGAKGPAMALTLIENLVAAGARNIVMPPCPICGSAAKLTSILGGVRCCSRCDKNSRVLECSRCRRRRVIGGRTLDGKPLCERCWQTDPLNHQHCTSCGRLRLIVERSGDQRLCGTCYTPPTATCSICGARRPCRFADTDSPQCTTCYRRLQPREECSGCGEHRPVNYRNGGRPYCKRCGDVPQPCSRCGKTYPVKSRTPKGEPLCQTCYAKDPSSHRTCTECGVHERLHQGGRCIACAARHSLRQALSGDDGHMRPELEPVFNALLRARPNAILDWVNRSTGRRAIFAALATSTGPITHQSLDHLRPVQVARNIRAALVAGGALPSRDERLAELETWLTKTIARLPAPDEQRILRSYITWHHLRRLRKPGQPVRYHQAQWVRHETRSVVRLLEWLHTNGSSLAECTQHTIDQWLADGSYQRQCVRGFLIWTTERHHTRPLHVPARQRDLALDVIAQDQRWNLIKRLLHDDELNDVDRVAGLLILLFAQTPSRIVHLTAKHVDVRDGRVTLRLGQVPVELPPPIDDLVLRLTHRRQTHTATAPPEENPGWLFPGGYPGQPLSPERLKVRLKAIGIRPRPARNTTLIELASELPTPIISRLLGLHQKTADSWSREAGTADAEYAAEITHR